MRFLNFEGRDGQIRVIATIAEIGIAVGDSYSSSRKTCRLLTHKT